MAEDYVEDAELWPILVSLQQCLCDEMNRAGVDSVECFCGVLPGALVTHDFPDGMAWVRLSQSYTSTNITDQARTLSNCALPIAGVIEIGIVRCAPSPGRSGTPPTVLQQFEATRLQMADMAIMRRAVVCCFGQSKDFSAQLSGYTPFGPQGGLVGGSWTLYAGRG